MLSYVMWNDSTMLQEVEEAAAVFLRVQLAVVEVRALPEFRPQGAPEEQPVHRARELAAEEIQAVLVSAVSFSFRWM